MSPRWAARGGATGGWHKAEQHVHGGGLAGSVGSQKAHNLTGLNLQIEPCQRHVEWLDNFAAAVFDAQSLNLQDCAHSIAGLNRRTSKS